MSHSTPPISISPWIFPTFVRSYLQSPQTNTPFGGPKSAFPLLRLWPYLCLWSWIIFCQELIPEWKVKVIWIQTKHFPGSFSGLFEKIRFLLYITGTIIFQQFRVVPQPVQFCQQIHQICQSNFKEKQERPSMIQMGLVWSIYQLHL